MAKLHGGLKPKIGPPSSYKPAYCEKIIEHMSLGLSIESFAGTIGTNKQTIYEWFDRHQAFADAKAIGMEKNRLFYERAGVGGMLGKIKNFNATVYVFNMKNRFPKDWNDRSQIDQTINANVKIQSWEDHLRSEIASKQSEIESQVEPLPVSGA